MLNTGFLWHTHDLNTSWDRNRHPVGYSPSQLALQLNQHAFFAQQLWTWWYQPKDELP